MDWWEQCDMCEARAYVRVIVNFVKPELRFCGHHFAESEEALNRASQMIIDYRTSVPA